MNTKTLIHRMLTENTGRHFLDSGGAYGRNWERNQKKTIEDFESEPSATLEVYRWERDGKVSYDFSPTISLFHHLTECLELDDLCREFNDLPVSDWDSEDFYGVSADGEEWIKSAGFRKREAPFNSYNWGANFSQTIQGHFLDLDGDQYVLLQIHGGCDVRGGYTDAQLFKIKSGETYSVFSEDCFFSAGDFGLSWSSEWINQEGGCATEEDFEQFASALNLTEENNKTIIEGDHYVYC